MSKLVRKAKKSRWGPEAEVAQRATCSTPSLPPLARRCCGAGPGASLNPSLSEGAIEGVPVLDIRCDKPDKGRRFRTEKATRRSSAGPGAVPTAPVKKHEALSSMSALKRPPDEPGSGEGGPPAPKKKIVIESPRIGPVSNNEEMDIKVLQFQHKKMKLRLEQRQRLEVDLRNRIESLEKRQTQDDAVLNVINRYWNQLNEDIRVLLQRYDAETSDEMETENESEETTSFLTQLASWDKNELDEKLANRVQVSTRAVAKIIQAFDRLQQRNEKISKAIKGELGEEPPPMDDIIKETYLEVEAENRRLSALNTSLHEKNHTIQLKFSEIYEKMLAKETEADERMNQVDELNWELAKLTNSYDQIASIHAELVDNHRKIKHMFGGEEKKDITNDRKSLDISDMELLNMQKENEELKEIAANRLIELEKLHQTQRETLKELEKLRMEIRTLPESVIVETTEYKCLQSKFSVIYNDTIQLRGSLEESKQNLFSIRTSHLKQVEAMEVSEKYLKAKMKEYLIEELTSEELVVQKKLRAEMLQLEDMLGQVRKEYELLRIEFEQNLTANEQTGPINREMRHLITSLQNHNAQLKGDAQRYRRKYRELLNDLNKEKREKDDLEVKATASDRDSLSNNSGLDGLKEEEDSPLASFPVIKDENNQCGKKLDGRLDGEEESMQEAPIKTEKLNDVLIKKEKGKCKCDGELKDLRNQLKKALNDSKEMKLLLDMYKGASKDQRDKVALMASEKKCRLELEEMKQLLRRLEESKKEEKKKLADEDAVRKIKSLEDAVHNLQRQVANQKQEEEALISEMEVTGQAYEDMQDQNSRLIQQLREKDEANFKLMSDRIKSNQVQKLAREEREILQEQIQTVSKQVEAQNQVVRKLEEKERLLLNSIATMEKEAIIRQQTMELHKRKAIESAQSAADLKLHLEKYHTQMKDAQQTVAEKTAALEAEAYKTKRLQEEIGSLRKKLDRLNKFEAIGSTDQVLMEEIREYKETLTCPSCKVKRKDAVLIKCFHVFCFDCLRTRYETRQRKCPKCNAAFGANDYHRLYLS